MALPRNIFSHCAMESQPMVVIPVSSIGISGNWFLGNSNPLSLPFWDPDYSSWVTFGRFQIHFLIAVSRGTWLHIYHLPLQFSSYVYIIIFSSESFYFSFFFKVVCFYLNFIFFYRLLSLQFNIGFSYKHFISKYSFHARPLSSSRYGLNIDSLRRNSLNFSPPGTGKKSSLTVIRSPLWFIVFLFPTLEPQLFLISRYQDFPHGGC